jgi:hypothetical protein
MEAARLAAEMGIDPSTGLLMFHPQTGRAPAGARPTANEGIGEYLYSKSKEIQARKDARAKEALQEMADRGRSARNNSVSQQLHIKIVARRFQEVGLPSRRWIRLARLSWPNFCNVTPCTLPPSTRRGSYFLAQYPVKKVVLVCPMHAALGTWGQTYVLSLEQLHSARCLIMRG